MFSSASSCVSGGLCKNKKKKERVLAQFFVPTVERRTVGDNQFAYRKKHRAKDAIAFYVCSWILALARGCKIGIYCADFSGAFDWVSLERLVRK